MRQLNGVYAQRFNRRHDCVGHLFQGRYGARLVQAEPYLLAVVRSVVRNPVVAGLCSSPREWAFSSHRAALGEALDGPADVETLLSYLGEPPEEARARYRELTEGMADDALPPHPLVIGEDGFVERALACLDPRPGVPGRYLRPPRPSLDILLGEARDAGTLARAQAAGYSLRELATYLGCNASTVSRRIRRRGIGATSGT